MSDSYPVQRRYSSNGDDAVVYTNGASHSPPPLELEPEVNPVREFFGLLRRHWLVVLVLVAACTGLAAYKASTDPPQFRASAVVRLSNSAQMMAGNLATPGLGGAPLGDPIESQINVLKSRSVTSMVVDAVGLRLVPMIPEFPYGVLENVQVAPGTVVDSLHATFGAAEYTVRSVAQQSSAPYGFPVSVEGVTLTITSRPPQEEVSFVVIDRIGAAAGLQSALQAQRRDRTDLIDIAYTAHDPILAQRVVNASVSSFQGFNAGTAQEEARRRRIFIEGQLAHTDSVFREAQLALANFRGAQREFSTREGLAARQQELAALTNERDQLVADRQIYQRVLDRLRDATAEERSQGIREITADPRLTASPTVSPYFTEYLRFQTSYDSLASSGRAPTHPEMQRVMAQRAGAENELLRAIGNYVDGVQGRIAVLQSLIGGGENRLQERLNPEAEEVRLLAEVEHLSSVATQLRTEYQQAQIEEAVQAGEIEIVDDALPGNSISAGRNRTILFGLILGMMLGGGAALLLEKGNTSIRRKDEVERILRIPELAVIPRFDSLKGASEGRSLLPARFNNNGKAAHGRPGELITVQDPHSTAAEAYRTLRTNLIFSQSLHALEAIVVTSSAPSEGKSTTAANLAATFAQQGKRVILIDCDLRKARLHKMFGVPREPGFTHLLLGLLPLEDLVRETSLPGLSFMASGTLPPNPAELVGGEQMKATLKLLRGAFDLIILDTPPILAASDAALLGHLVDGVVLVVRAGQTERDAAKQSVRHLINGRARILGAVLNDPDGKVGKYGGHYQYEYYGERVKTPTSV